MLDSVLEFDLGNNQTIKAGLLALEKTNYGRSEEVDLDADDDYYEDTYLGALTMVNEKEVLQAIQNALNLREDSCPQT